MKYFSAPKVNYLSENYAKASENILVFRYLEDIRWEFFDRRKPDFITFDGHLDCETS